MIFSIDSSTLLPKRAALGKVHPDRSGALRELHTPPPVTPDAASRPISATPARIDGTNRCCWAEQGRRSEIGNHGSDVGSRLARSQKSMVRGFLMTGLRSLVPGLTRGRFGEPDVPAAPEMLLP